MSTTLRDPNGATGSTGASMVVLVLRVVAHEGSRNTSNLLLSVREHTCCINVILVGRVVCRVTLVSGSVIFVSVFAGPSRISSSVASG